MSVRRRYVMTTLALLALGLSYAATRGGGDRPGAVPRPPARATALAPPAELAPLTAEEILARSGPLSLTRAQRRRLETLASEWRAGSAKLEADLDAAVSEFSRFMDEARAGRGASLAEIQRRSADVRDLGATLRAQRAVHAEAAARVLTDSQRTRLGRTLDASGGAR